MADHSNNVDGDHQEVLLLTYHDPCAIYYVHSPSTLSHTNSDFRNNELPSSTTVSPFRASSSESFVISNNIRTNTTHYPSRFVHSRYPSSRESNSSFLDVKTITYDVHDNDDDNCGQDQNFLEEVDEDPSLVLCKKKQKQENEEDDEDYEDDYNEDMSRKGWERFFSFDTSSSCLWVSIQIFWRLLVSFGAALLVFYLATKPPTPIISIKIARIGQFGLGEGVDESGVTTKILTCNTSIALQVINKSKLFPLHIHPSTTQMFFGPLIFATSQGSETKIESTKSTRFELYAGTKNKAMYGAGRSMQDLLESRKGLPLIIRMSLTSNFNVISNLIKPKFSHQFECMLIVHRPYDKIHRTQIYNSKCRTTSIKRK